MVAIEVQIRSDMKTIAVMLLAKFHARGISVIHVSPTAVDKFFGKQGWHRTAKDKKLADDQADVRYIKKGGKGRGRWWGRLRQ